MKNKKFISLVLALAMVFSMSVSVFAEGEEDDNKTFTATAEVKIPAIDVTVPATAPLFINPMGFSVNITDGKAAAADAEEGTATSEKVVSPLFQIKNASPMKLDVGVIASASAVTPVGDATTATMSIASAPIADGDTKNSVFIYANFGKPTGEDDEAKLDKVAYDAEKAATLAITPKAPKDPVVVGTVDAGGDDATVFGFQFFGDCNANAKNEWTAGEKVTVTLVFSFKPNLA